MKGTFSDHKKSPYVCIQQDILFCAWNAHDWTW